MRERRIFCKKGMGERKIAWDPLILSSVVSIVGSG